MPGRKPVSGETVIKILSKEYGFTVSGRSGSHVRLSKETPAGKVGTVVPLHRELKTGTLRGVLKLAKIDPDDFAQYL
ncbi:putative RNA binding protein YcfA (HicA-like mRNA interferase family) [Methanofollis sp. W23]|uniref:type II toxin-antitoxin system HicA family toxin n=1 Tax=Methanofollis sp. W23 TaxID=2817849 RepID=UPI001AE483A7|nr:putative RNA binding protein YcfA (HicA-like mRNA interferase family) [Methanofollis sp. W23]